METSPATSTDIGIRRYGLVLLVLYPLLAVAGAISQRAIFPLLALLLLLTVVLLPRLLARRVGAWLLWMALFAGLLVMAWLGLAESLLGAVPVLVNLLLACWFGLSLVGDEPLVARFIVTLEGEQRLQQPGVRRYARQLTWFWTLLLGGQAIVLAVLVLCAGHDGLLVRMGMLPMLSLPAGWAAAWIHIGSYALLGIAFPLEYAWRRWRLRHLSHPRLHDMLLQLARDWPRLLHGPAANVS